MVVVLLVPDEAQQVCEQLSVVFAELLELVDQAGVKLPLPSELADVLVLLAYFVEADDQLFGVV